jgi:hypothetical protein
MSEKKVVIASKTRWVFAALVAFVLCVAGSVPAIAQTSTITLASGAGVTFPFYGATVEDPSVEVSRNNGVTWMPAYAGQNPWGASPFAGATWTQALPQLRGNPEPLRYRITFSMPAGFTSPSLSGRVWSDDQTAAVVLNGAPILTIPSGPATYPLGSGVQPFATANPALFLSGMNILEFATVNLGGVGGITFSGNVSWQGGFYPPVISRISPAAGPSSGNTVVTITGSNFVPGSTSFGRFASSASCSSTTQCTITTAPGRGLVQLHANTPYGTSVSTLASEYTFTQDTPCANLITGATLATGTRLSSVAAADFNRDGRLDLAVTNQVSNDVTILLNTPGDGGQWGQPLVFQPATQVLAGTRPEFVAVNDFNSDHVADLAVANDHSNNVSILLGIQSGGFAAPIQTAVGTSPYHLATADFNGDGRADLAVPNYTSRTISILLGTGTGTFSRAASLAVAGNPRSVAIGDFNGDGAMDLVSANQATHDVSVFLGTGAGTFGARTSYPADSTPEFVAVSDFNGDGRSDLAVTNADANNLSILLGTGSGAFIRGAVAYAGAVPFALGVSDFNGDGASDLAVANLGGDVSLLLGTGAGTFDAPLNFAAGDTPFGLALGDFNGDGRGDVAVGNQGSNDVSILLYPYTLVHTGNMLVPEMPRSIQVPVFREGGGSTGCTVTIDYATKDGTATAGADYLATSGTLTFEPGVETLSVDITLVDDAIAEPVETFSLVLSNPSAGVDLPSLAAASTITIVDDPIVAVPGPIAVDATSTAGTTVTFTATVLDPTHAGPVTCSPASGSTFAIGTTTVTCSATNIFGQTGSAGFTVTVHGASAQTDALLSSVAALGPDGNGLSSKLNAVQSALAKGNTQAACGSLNAFTQQVEAKVKSHQLTTAQAAELLAAATRIASTIGCSN